MKFVTCDFTGPDSDGDINFDFKVNANNSTEHDIELIKYGVLLIGEDDVIIDGSNDNEDESFIEPKDSGDFDVYFSYLNVNRIGKNKKIKALIDATFYRCEFHNLGEHNLPKSPTEPVLINNSLDIGGILKSYGVSVHLGKEDDEGQVEVSVFFGVRNVSDMHFEKIRIDVKILDKRGSEVDESYDEQQAAPKSCKLLNTTFWGLNPKKLKDSKVQITVKLFQPVMSDNCQGELNIS